MRSEPPEQSFQDSLHPKILEYHFKTPDQKNKFVLETIKSLPDQVHYYLTIDKTNCCIIKLFSENQNNIKSSENTLNNIANKITNYNEKNKWWPW